MDKGIEPTSRRGAVVLVKKLECAEYEWEHGLLAERWVEAVHVALDRQPGQLERVRVVIPVVRASAWVKVNLLT